MASIDKINVGGAEYDINPAPSDTKDDTISFTSNDNSSIFNSGNLGGQSAYAWTAVSKIATGEKHSSLLNKVSTMFKNIRTIAKLIGTTDISSIGDGTLSGGISSLKDSLSDISFTINLHEREASNIDGTVFATGNIALIFINAPKTAMTQNVAYNCGDLGITIPTALYQIEKVFNGRHYYFSIIGGNLMMSCGDSLPSGGIPLIAGVLAVPINRS